MREPSANDGKTQIGFIAQELDEDLGEKNNIINAMDKLNPDKQHAAPSNLIPVLVKAVQELSVKVKTLEKG